MNKHKLTKFSTVSTSEKSMPSPYSIFCAWAWGLHPNVILSWYFQVGNPEIPKIRAPKTLEAYNFLCGPLIEVRFKEKF